MFASGWQSSCQVRSMTVTRLLLLRKVTQKAQKKIMIVITDE